MVHPKTAEARLEHVVYFQDTPYELNVYKINGRKDGPTMMIVGGIQGDEPGGFLSADLYIDLALKKGNLIIVPRANFFSILMSKRGPNGDMNRKFGLNRNQSHEDRIVRILEQLIAESDVLLNLHDGWGFYRPTYVSKMANPMRYGQSIIADTSEYHSSRTGHVLKLQETAEKAIALINEQIDNSQYHFHFMNTRTAAKDSPYSEQKTSATFYALTRHGIPAFGVETSKNLPTIEMKVYQHNLAINAFMKIFGIELEQPRIYLEEPKLEYLVVAINGSMPVAVADGRPLHLNPGDEIEIVHVEANYERGLSVDIQGLGTINDFRRKFRIDRPTFIVAQKDHIKFGRVPVVLKPPETRPALIQARAPAPAAPKPEPEPVPRLAEPKKFQVLNFVLEVNGERRLVPDGGRLEAVDGDALKIIDIESVGPAPPNLVVNFKGFVSNQTNNTGEDRGALINTAQDLLARYSLSKSEKIYEIVVERGKTALAGMTIRLDRPRLDYVLLSHNGGPGLKLKPGEMFETKPGDRVRILELKTNVPANDGVKVFVRGPIEDEGPARELPAFQISRTQPVTLIVTRDGLTLGKVVFNSG